MDIDIKLFFVLEMAPKKDYTSQQRTFNGQCPIIIVDKRQETPFKYNIPDNWYSSFLKRHPMKTYEQQEINVTQEDIEKWFSEVVSDLTHKDLIETLKYLERIFNTNESAFFLYPKPGHVLARKGDKNVDAS